MTKIDYYIVYTGLLIVWIALLWYWEEMYSGMFLWVFFTWIKDILNIKKEELQETRDEIEMEEMRTD